MAENNISLKEAIDLNRMDRKELPSITNVKSWPRINTRNSPTFEDIRIRRDDLSKQKERGKSTYSEIMQVQVQNVDKKTDSDSDNSWDEEERNNRK